MAIRIVLADDADLVIEGAQSVLSADHRFHVVGTARCMDDLLKTIEAGYPDVVVLSEWIHNLDILSAVEAIHTVRPGLKVIVMGGLADGLLIRDLFACGVSGYLYKSDDLCELLVTAIDTVLLDRPYLSPTANAEYLIAMQSPNANGSTRKRGKCCNCWRMANTPDRSANGWASTNAVCTGCARNCGVASGQKRTNTLSSVRLLRASSIPTTDPTSQPRNFAMRS
jgi:DNA-binding NarL/FixJ family response regulator